MTCHELGRGAFALVAALAIAGCAPALGRSFAPARLEREPGWIAARGVPYVAQPGDMDCGPAAIATLLDFWRRPETPSQIRAALHAPADRGVTAAALRDHLRARGLAAYLFDGEYADLERELAAGRPVVVGSVRRAPGGLVAHYLVVVGLHPRFRSLAVIDPAAGWRQIPRDRFEEIWRAARRLVIVAFAPQAPDPGDAGCRSPVARCPPPVLRKR